MAKRSIQFRYPETNQVYKLLSGLASRGHNLSRVFEDFLSAIVCSFSMGQLEDRYMEIAARYSDGNKGNRGIDIIAHAFGELVNAMEKTKADILGDFFEGCITFGENGQFFTPEALCEVLARMTIDENQPVREDGSPLRINDCACGSGRILLAAAKLAPGSILYGCDVDHRCVMMTTINLALNGLRGYAVWGDSLRLVEHGHYAVGEMGIPGLVRWDPRPILTVASAKAEPATSEETPADAAKPKQLSLIDAA